MKGDRMAPEMAKNGDEGVIFDRLRGAHRPPSGAETSVPWSSATPLPRCLVRVGFLRRHDSQMARASHG